MLNCGGRLQGVEGVRRPNLENSEMYNPRFSDISPRFWWNFLERKLYVDLTVTSHIKIVRSLLFTFTIIKNKVIFVMKRFFTERVRIKYWFEIYVINAINTGSTSILYIKNVLSPFINKVKTSWTDNIWSRKTVTNLRFLRASSSPPARLPQFPFSTWGYDGVLRKADINQNCRYTIFEMNFFPQLIKLRVGRGEGVYIMHFDH